MERISGLVFDDGVKTVNRIGSVFDDTFSAIRLDEAVTSAHHIADTFLLLRFVVTSVRTVYVVFVPVAGRRSGLVVVMVFGLLLRRMVFVYFVEHFVADFVVLYLRGVVVVVVERPRLGSMA